MPILFWGQRSKGQRSRGQKHGFYLRRSRYTITRVRHRVRPSVRLALPQGSCRVPYQYRGHLSHKKSLVAFFRQVMMINRDKIVRFGEKFGKKIFATTFFRTEICPCPSEIKKSPSVKFLRAAGQFLSKVAHVTCLDQWESISDKIGSDMRSEAAILLLSERPYREVVASLFESEAILIKIRWVHL